MTTQLNYKELYEKYKDSEDPKFKIKFIMLFMMKSSPYYDEK
jgi:hypothetical protein